MSDPIKSIRIGTMVSCNGGDAAARMQSLTDKGFESFEPFFWQTTEGQDLEELGKRCRDAIGDADITMSTLGMFGNPLETDPMDLETLSQRRNTGSLMAVESASRINILKLSCA